MESCSKYVKVPFDHFMRALSCGLRRSGRIADQGKQDIAGTFLPNHETRSLGLSHLRGSGLEQLNLRKALT